MKVLIISTNILPAAPLMPVYLLPDLPKSYLEELLPDLCSRQGYSVQFNNPRESWNL